MKVLIVDDSQFQRLVVKSIVSNYSEELEVIELTDAQKALDLLKEGGISLVFSDINMEPFTGIELVEKSKEASVETTFALVTSHLVDSMKEKAASLGVEYYITKPITQEKIEAVLKEVLGA